MNYIYGTPEKLTYFMSLIKHGKTRNKELVSFSTSYISSNIYVFRPQAITALSYF